MDHFLTSIAPLFGGKISPAQREGLLFLRSAIAALPLPQQAYVLATVFHETAALMQPVTERGQRSYFDKYEPATKLGRALGNLLQGDGFLYRGRGYVQLTGRANYARAGRALGVDLLTAPDLALRRDLAARILREGMAQGWFTGKKLSDYLGGGAEGRDYLGARRIVNGQDRAAEIAAYAEAFERALQPKARPWLFEFLSNFFKGG